MDDGKGERKLELCDGGVANNNPSLQAATLAATSMGDSTSRGLDTVAVLSIGTGNRSFQCEDAFLDAHNVNTLT